MILAAGMLAAATARGAGPRRLVERGNAAFAADAYEEALRAYEEAAAALPEAAEMDFNRGTVHYRQADFAAARRDFLSAALKSRTPALDARARYNLGNAVFREAQDLQNIDAQRSVEFYEQSIRHYREALELDPEMRAAAENIEVARLTIRRVLDELARQEERQQTEETLEQLAEAQKQAAADSRRLQGEQAPEDPGAGDTRRTHEQAAEQQQELRQETEAAAADIPPQEDSSAPEEAARRHLDRALQRQAAAEQELRDGQSGKAAGEQEEAAQALAQALEALRGSPSDRPEPAEENPDKPGPPADEGLADESPPSGGPPPPGAQEHAAVQLPDEARDILNEERDRREQRRRAAIGHRPVERDW